MEKIRLALLCGGTSSEREVSLKGAEGIKKSLSHSKYDVKIYDTSKDLTKLIQDRENLDVAFILLHGKFGEDGTIQGFLELLGIPYQGSGVLGSAISMDKNICKEFYLRAGVNTPKWLSLTKNEGVDVDYIANRFKFPVIVKPTSGGSSIGVNIAKNYEELTKFIDEAFKHDSNIIIEEYIKGKEITSGILENKDGSLIALPLVEIRPKQKYLFFDYDAKYKSGETEEICPAPLPKDIEEKAKEYALKIHKSLYLRDYSRTDMIVSENGEVYVLETNTIPGMTPTSLFPLAAKTYGIEFPELLNWLIELALGRKI